MDHDLPERPMEESALYSSPRRNKEEEESKKKSASFSSNFTYHEHVSHKSSAVNVELESDRLMPMSPPTNHSHHSENSQQLS